MGLPDIPTLISWLTGGWGRLFVAALIFLAMWGLKSIPAVEEELLTTPRRRQLAAAFLSTMPAVWMLAAGAAVDEVSATAVTAFLGSMGIHVGGKVVLNKGPVGVPVIEGRRDVLTILEDVAAGRMKPDHAANIFVDAGFVVGKPGPAS